jgi:hypothetical protein
MPAMAHERPDCETISKCDAEIEYSIHAGRRTLAWHVLKKWTFPSADDSSRQRRQAMWGRAAPNRWFSGERIAQSASINIDLDLGNTKQRKFLRGRPTPIPVDAFTDASRRRP